MRGKTSQVIAAVLMLIIAGVIIYRSMGPQPAVKAYFYDLSKNELFVADANLIPPIRGIDNAEEDGVKAVVIAPANNLKARRIAYLERYSPELKKDMEEARARNSAPMVGRGASQALRFVRREKDSNWFSLISAEGERIVSEWTVPGPDGLSPVVCTP